MSQHVAASALDETWAVACDDEFGLFTEHVDALLCGSFYDGVSGVNYRYQNGAKRDAKDVCGILLPMRRHPKQGGCEWGVAADLFVQIVVVVSMAVGV